MSALIYKLLLTENGLLLFQKTCKQDEFPSVLLFYAAVKDSE